ncbi:hypothetical protein BC832DRAFT_44537 [Gaertneriomyces semiglobifer]|nr:hypothetical protein BC832DRAFT_44537 [Gaertneriomyces semiglobifer]
MDGMLTTGSLLLFFFLSSNSRFLLIAIFPCDLPPAFAIPATPIRLRRRHSPTQAQNKQVKNAQNSPKSIVKTGHAADRCPTRAGVRVNCAAPPECCAFHLVSH